MRVRVILLVFLFNMVANLLAAIVDALFLVCTEGGNSREHKERVSSLASAIILRQIERERERSEKIKKREFLNKMWNCSERERERGWLYLD